MRIAVTGASGFVGGRVVNALAQDGHEVFAFGRRSAGELAAHLPSYVSWDLRYPLLDAPHVDVVVHCGALVGDWGAEALYREVNVNGTRAVIDSFPNARIVYTSTSSVYSDRQPHAVITEVSPTGNCRYSAYARSKWEAETLLLRRGNSVVLRPHIVYGPGDTTLLPRLLAARRLGALPVPGTGRNELSVTHVDNLVDAIIAATVWHPDATGAFNIADAEAVTVDRLLRTLFERLELPTRIVYVPKNVAFAAASLAENLWLGPQLPPRGPSITRYVVHQLAMTHVLDTTRAQQQLYYRPTRDYRTAPL